MLIYSKVNWFCNIKKGQIMKKLGLLTAALLLTGTANARAQLVAQNYDECINNANGDLALKDCVLNETSRIMAIVEGKYEQLANSEYFKGWNAGAGMFNGNFKQLLDEWNSYRDDYCSLYSYSTFQGEGTLGQLNAAECVLELTKRQNKDITVILNNYKQAIANSN